MFTSITLSSPSARCFTFCLMFAVKHGIEEEDDHDKYEEEYLMISPLRTFR